MNSHDLKLLSEESSLAAPRRNGLPESTPDKACVKDEEARPGSGPDVAKANAEAQGLQSNRSHLERLARERTAELERANQQLRHEVAERKRAEEEVRELGQFLEMVIDNANIWLKVLDRDKGIVLWNKAAEEMSGYSRDEVVGNSRVWEWLYPDEDYRNEIVQKASAILEKGEVVEDFETTIRSKEGLSRIISWHSKALLNREGLPMGSIALGRDVTGLKVLEAQLRRAQKIEAIGTLAAGIAHDFNNILGIIFGYAEMALQESPEEGPLRSYIQEVLKASTRAREVVKQILAFSKRIRSEPKPIQVGPVIEDVLRLMRATFPPTISIVQNISSDGLVVADPVQVHEIVTQLCTNARHTMKEKGGLLKVGLDEVVLGAGGRGNRSELRPGSYLKLTVSDTGHGMSGSVMERIFDPYFTTRGVGEGSGLGLAVVHGMVQNMKGEIEVDSEPGEGATFRVFLPISPPVKSARCDKPAGQAGESKGRVLLVDDEEGLVAVGSEMLRRFGYTVASTTNGLEALELFRLSPSAYDVVVTDQTMPDIRGDELARKMLSIRPDVPIILCTGFSELVNERKAREIGIRRFLMKPVLIRELAQVICEVMEGNREDRG
jgi:PAS domain S-box-containing protein